MLFEISQKTLPHLPGASFLAVLQQFRNEPLAVLHSGNNQGHSILARKPLLTMTALTPNSLELHSHAPIPHLPQIPPHLNIIHQWQSLLDTLPFTSAHSHAGWIGHVAYDIFTVIENISRTTPDDLHVPLLHWQLFEEYFIFDHAAQTYTLVATSYPKGPPAEKTLKHMQHRLAAPIPPSPPRPIQSHLLESMPREEYIQKINRIKDYIAAGDIYQANFSQRWKIHTDANPITLFLNLARESPAPYSALLIDGNRATLSASPELFLHREHDHLLTKPIKGTRPRNLQNTAEDEARKNELLHSEKDRAELAMIVDLLRNDLGKVARFGSVHVTNPREIEPHPTVWHTVATIEADFPTTKAMRAGDWSNLLHALCPGGSITGAPKIRAMQIIEELEPTRRGLYCGNIGLLTPNPPYATLNIAIRTIQLIGQTAYLHAGSGIVADSDPEQEYEECLHKAAALFRALNLPLPPAAERRSPIARGDQREPLENIIVK